MKIKNGICLGLATVVLTCCFGVHQALATSVSVEPQAPAVFVGSNQVFTALTDVMPGDTITAYSWRFSTNDLPPFETVVSNATATSISLTNLQTTNAGFYFVSVTYNSGANTGLTAVSTAVQLTVEDQARITSQPQPTLIEATGNTATFTVTALGQAPLSYQWQFNNTNLTDGGRISGSGSNTLTITGLLVSDSGNYDVILSNVFASVTSQVSALSVYVPPFVSNQTSNLVVLSGRNAVFNVTPGGSPPFIFQWQRGMNNLSDGGRISGSASNVLTITDALTNDDGQYTLFFSNPVGATSSVPVSLTVELPPVITSATNITGQQGFALNYQTKATGTTPITFGASNLPIGLEIDSTNGLISGTPLVSDEFEVTLSAANAATTTFTNLFIFLVTDVPGITSSTNANGKQGAVFTYTIKASNSPVIFSAAGLPAGINLNPLTGVITGPPIVSGTFPVVIGAGNQFGTNTTNLNLIIASDIPVITSSTNVNGVENATNFSYTITASNSPTTFGAIGLPSGLTLNPTNGAITGTVLYGGTNFVTVTAANAYGVGSTNVQFSIAYEPLTKLLITQVTNFYSSPYLLDFTFTLQDSNGNSIARPPDQIQVQSLEGNLTTQTTVPIPDETTNIVNRLISGTSSAKTLKTFFCLDYTYSMFITPNAITDMQNAVENLIDQEPPSAQFGVDEFSADYIAPILVTGFTSDKALLTADIQGIQSNYVQGNYAGTRLYDALAAAIGQFTAPNPDEQRFLIVMTDGNDDSSILGTTTNDPTLPDVVVSLANAKDVQIFAVGFGTDVNTNDLLQITSQTQGQFYPAANAADVATQFSLLLKDLNSEYTLRWATLQRSTNGFQPMFTVTVDGVTAGFNTNFVLQTNTILTTNSSTGTNDVSTNTEVTNISLVPIYFPQTYAGNVLVGALTFIPDATSNASSVTLRATYVPRYIRQFSFDYRPNFPCTPTLLSDGPGEILSGWSLTQTNDGSNGFILIVSSPDVSNVLSSLPYGITSDLLDFQFQYQALPTPQQAFASFSVINSIYSNTPPSGQSFVLSNLTSFVTNFPPAPPFGTPVPWLESFGFTSNFAAVELSDPNGTGMLVWQDYIAGLNPTNANSTFSVLPINPPSSGPPIITFNTALGRTYRVDTATILGVWSTLQDNIPGTGGLVSITDNRNLSGVSSVFYRVVVFY